MKAHCAFYQRAVEKLVMLISMWRHLTKLAKSRNHSKIVWTVLGIEYAPGYFIPVWARQRCACNTLIALSTLLAGENQAVRARKSWAVIIYECEKLEKSKIDFITFLTLSCAFRNVRSVVKQLLKKGSTTTIKIEKSTMKWLQWILRISRLHLFCLCSLSKKNKNKKSWKEKY